MAYMRMKTHNRFANIGEKVKQGAEIAGALKSIYEIGSSIYRGAQALAPGAAGVASIAAGAVL